MHSHVTDNDETVTKRRRGTLQLLLRRHFWNSHSEDVWKCPQSSQQNSQDENLPFPLKQNVKLFTLTCCRQRHKEVFFFPTHLTVTFVALMFTTIHCKIKRILIVGICYSLGGGGSVALEQTVSWYQVDSIHTCFYIFRYLQACLAALFTCQDIFLACNGETLANVCPLSTGWTQHLHHVATDNVDPLTSPHTSATINKLSNPAANDRHSFSIAHVNIRELQVY